MKISRNDPCPCGSGKKYKKCCLEGAPANLQPPNLPPRYRFEPGSYGGGGLPYMPSLVCYRQEGAGPWREYYCLIKQKTLLSTAHEAASEADADGAEAAVAKRASGLDEDFATVLKHKGYVRIDGFRRAATVPKPAV